MRFHLVLLGVVHGALLSTYVNGFHKRSIEVSQFDMCTDMILDDGTSVTKWSGHVLTPEDLDRKQPRSSVSACPCVSVFRCYCVSTSLCIRSCARFLRLMYMCYRYF